MEGQSTWYTYSPLDESRRQIRLLHLLPAGKRWNGAQDGTDDPVETVMSQAEDIHCTFSIASLDDYEDDPIEDDQGAGFMQTRSFDGNSIENDFNKGETLKDKAEVDASEDHHVKYEAISYVWGDTNDMKTVYLHGHAFLVTKNLYSALLHMRRTEERIMWVDALCINQADLSERASQVSQMDSVYKQADVVVVYLGEWEKAADTFQLIEALGADEDQHHHNAATTQEVLRSFSVELNPQRAKVCLIEFFSLPWWNRLWTVQEYVLAKTIIFQSRTSEMPEACLGKYFRCLDSHSSCCFRTLFHPGSWLYLTDDLFDCISRAATIFEIRNDSYDKQRKWDMVTILDLRSRECSNPSDKIYGILALTPKLFQEKMQPNYSLAYEVVFTMATFAWIASTGSLDILSCVDRSGLLSSGTPSYVPDYGTDMNEEGYPEEVDTLFLRSRVGKMAFFHATEAHAPTTLALPSLQMSTDAIFIDTVLRFVDMEAYLGWLNGLPHTDIASSEPFLSRYATPHQALWQNFCGSLLITPSLEARLVTDNDYTTFQEWRKCEDESAHNNDKGTYGFQRIIERMQHRRKLGITTSGYVGLIPEVAEPGDHVVLMPGGKVPYIIRQLGEPYEHSNPDGESTFTDRFEFMGDCYIHGIMFGEAWDETKLQPIVLA